jgi:peptidoglycan/xylan/chitin deacetylase (PgdA/CDA1 family)
VDTDLLDGFEEYIRILDRHGIKSTLFTVGDLAPHIADRLRPCIASGHRLALHNHAHVPPMDESPEQFRKQTRRAKNRLQKLFGTEVAGFRAPCFSMNKTQLEVLRELGFRYDSSHLNYLAARHTVALDLDDYRQLRTSIYHRDGFYEFGLSSGKVLDRTFPISGGGYVRLPPWWFVKSMIRKHIQSSDYYVFYLHPFELTRRKIPFIKELKAYDKYYTHHGIRTYGKRVESIIKMLKKQGYEFVTFEELTQILTPETASV